MTVIPAAIILLVILAIPQIIDNSTLALVDAILSITTMIQELVGLFFVFFLLAVAQYL